MDTEAIRTELESQRADLLDGAEALDHADVGDDAAEEEDRLPVDGREPGLAQVGVEQGDDRRNGERDDAELELEAEQSRSDETQDRREEREEKHRLLARR